MSLGPFQILMLPVKENGVIQFYDDEDSDIIKATFSRPDIGATSGHTVYDKNGNISELLEDDAPFSYPKSGGCPVLQVRKQVANIGKDPSNFNTSLLVKSDPATEDAEGVSQTQFAAVSNGVNQAFGDISIACDEETEYSIWAVFESTGTNDVSFAIVDDSSPSSVIRYRTDDLTLSQSGNFSDVALEDLGNGSYKLSGILTTATGQTTIAPRFRMLTTGGGSSITANGQIMLLSQFQINEGKKTEFIPPGASGLTRSASHVDIDLTSILSDNELSILFEGSISEAGADLFMIDNGSETNGFIIGLDNDKLRVRYRNGGGLSTLAFGTEDILINTSFKVAITITESHVVLSVNGGTDISIAHDSSGLPQLTRIRLRSIFDTVYDNDYKRFKISSFPLSESVINLETA